MELKIKTKIENGKKVMGIINENLKQIAPFEFKNISEVGNHLKYYICEKEDGTCSLYDYNGYCRISCNDGYKDLKVLKYSFKNETISVVAKKDDEIGILYAGIKRKNGCKNPSETKVEVAYKFGKCDDIKEYDDESVQLIKYTKGEDRIGYWYHKNIRGLVEPKFLSYDYYRIKSKKPGLYRFSDDQTFGYRLSDYIEYDKLTTNIEMIKYTKANKVIGLKQRCYDCGFKFVDFLPATYSNISYDEEKQIFFLEEIVNGEVKKGFVGVTQNGILIMLVVGYGDIQI